MTDALRDPPPMEGPRQRPQDDAPIAAGKVSIVIPCFNHGAMLRETLGSIERVGNENIAEVIIVNDGSTDPETCKYFDELAGSPYTIIHQPNRGLGPARNVGVQIAKGEFILPLDSDNLIRECYLKRGVEILLERPEVGVAYGDRQLFGEKTDCYHLPEFDLCLLVRANYIDACALYRKSVWTSVNGYDEEMPWMGWEDWDFWIRVALRGWRFAHIDEVAFDYRVSHASMINETNKHIDELTEYVFSKPGHALLRELRRASVELSALQVTLKGIEGSRDYRIGRAIVTPLRTIKRMLSK